MDSESDYPQPFNSSQPTQITSLNPILIDSLPQIRTENTTLNSSTQSGSRDPIDFKEVFKQMAFGGLVQDVTYDPKPHPQKDLAVFLAAIMSKIKPILEQAINDKKGVAFWISVQVKYSDPSKNSKEMRFPYLHSGQRRLVHLPEMDSVLEEITQSILIHHTNFINQNSTLAIEDIKNFRFKKAEFIPIAGRGNRVLPPFLARKRAIINVQNSDERCFGYAVLSALEPVSKDPYRPTKYNNLFHQYHLDTIPYPVSIDQIQPIEDMLQVAINVYSFYDDEGKGRYPLYVSKKKNVPKSIDLLFWDDHYAWIKSFPSFMADLVKNHTLHWCRTCLDHFYNEPTLKKHQLYCAGIGDCKQLIMRPEGKRKVRFENQLYVYSLGKVILILFSYLMISVHIPFLYPKRTVR